MKEWSVKEDRKMANYGETDYGKGEVRINPSKGDVVNTVIHENLHKRNPEMPHDEVYRQAAAIEGSMSMREMGRLLNQTADEMDNYCYAPKTNTIASKVIKLTQK